MKKKNIRMLFAGVGLLAAFVLWTVLVRFVDVRSIGPEGSSVGFATLNGYMRELIGVNMPLYVITDWLGLVPIGVALGFAVLGSVQLVERRSLFRVERSILVLGVFYLVVMAVFLLFEIFAINYRPVLIDGVLEASYPSSTTMLVACVMPTALMQLRTHVRSRLLLRCMRVLTAVFVAFMIAARLLSGVHWLTDIIGAGLISTGLVLLYRALTER